MRKKLKPAYISLIVVLIFALAVFFGRRSEWWITEGRKTPFDVSNGGGGGHGEGTEEHEEYDEYTQDELEEHTEDEHTEDEEHELTEISGSATVQNALDMGITMEELEMTLEGEITDTSAKIQYIAEERVLSFGKVKDMLNAYLAD